MPSCDFCKYENFSLHVYPCTLCIGRFDTEKYWEPKEPKGLINMSYADYVYEIVKNECKDLDSVYEDYIVNLVGEYGLKFLYEIGKIPQ